MIGAFERMQVYGRKDVIDRIVSRALDLVSGEKKDDVTVCGSGYVDRRQAWNDMRI